MPEDMLLALEEFVTRERSGEPTVGMLEMHAFNFDIVAARQNRR